MASGTIYGTTSNQYIEAKVEWESVANTQYNQSTMVAKLYYRRTNTGYETSGSGEFSISIGGWKKTEFISGLEIGTGWVFVMQHDVWFDHEADGTKSVTIVATGSLTGTTLKYTSLSRTVALDTIARASTPSASSVTLGNNCLISWTPSATTFKYKLTLSIGGWSKTTDFISPNTTSNYTYKGYTIPLDVANQISSTSTMGKMTATLTTYTSAGSQVGSPSATTFTVTIPNNASTQPTVDTLSLAPVNSDVPYNGLYLKGASKVKATSFTYSAKFGATVEAKNITVEGKSYEYPYESGILTQDGTITVKATVKDSRGFYGTYYKDIEVIPYSRPYVSVKSGETSIIAARCDKDANFTDSGTYLKIKAKVVYSKVISDGRQNNYGRLKFRYRQEGGSYSPWQTIHDSETDSNHSDEVITAPLLNGDLDTKLNYQVQIVAFDDLYESEPITIAIPSDAVYMDRPAGGKSMGLGGYSSGDGNLDIHWKTKARGGVSLFDSKGDEIPLDSTMPLPRGQVAEGYDPNNLANGIYVVAKNYALKTSEGTVIMYNGVLIQMPGDVGSNVKIQLAFPIDDGRSPMQRLYWYDTWSSWKSMKL